MRRITKAILLVLSFCVVLLAAGALWLSYGNCADLPRLLYHRIALRDKDFVDKDIHFQVRMVGRSRAPDGVDIDFTKVRASDCVQVIFETESLDSPSHAESEMKKRIRDASRVIEQEPRNVDLPKQTDGTRVVLLFEQPEKAEIIFWLKGESKLRAIESPSLSHALAYEKLIQHRFIRLDAKGYVMPPTP